MQQPFETSSFNYQTNFDVHNFGHSIATVKTASQTQRISHFLIFHQLQRS